MQNIEQCVMIKCVWDCAADDNSREIIMKSIITYYEERQIEEEAS